MASKKNKKTINGRKNETSGRYAKYINIKPQFVVVVGWCLGGEEGAL